MVKKASEGSYAGNSSKRSEGTISFPCPKCMKAEIIRSRHDRKLAVKYKCPGCGFIGPN